MHACDENKERKGYKSALGPFQNMAQEKGLLLSFECLVLLKAETALSATAALYCSHRSFNLKTPR